ncbi:MAG: hypothetical protein ABIZ04_10215 [Opitutus sp.]
MSRAPWIFIGLVGVLTAGIVTTLVLQRQTEGALRNQLVLEREQNLEVNRLRELNRRLLEAQASEEQVSALRGDRVALERLRGDIDALTNRATESARSAAPKKSAPSAFIPVSAWKNAGRATPAAVLQTVLWAAAGGDLDALTQTLFLDAKVKAQADRIFAGLPDGIRQQYGSAERLIALLTAKDVPLGAMQPLEEKAFGPNDVAIAVRLQSPEGKTTAVVLTAHRVDDGWRLKVPASALQKYVNALQRPTTAAAAR